MLDVFVVFLERESIRALNRFFKLMNFSMREGLEGLISFKTSCCSSREDDTHSMCFLSSLKESI